MRPDAARSRPVAIEETLADNRIFVACDLGGWSKGMNRDVFGRVVEVAVNRQ